MNRARWVRAAGAALAATLACAAPAAADSISYVRDGNVFLTAPDGSRTVQVTTAGGYSSASQADDGRIVALKGNRFHLLDRWGGVQADFSPGRRRDGRDDHAQRPVRSRDLARRHPDRLRLLRAVPQRRSRLRAPRRVPGRPALRGHRLLAQHRRRRLARARLHARVRLGRPVVDRQRLDADGRPLVGLPEPERDRHGRRRARRDGVVLRPQRGHHEPLRRRDEPPEDGDRASCATPPATPCACIASRARRPGARPRGLPRRSRPGRRVGVAVVGAGRRAARGGRAAGPLRGRAAGDRCRRARTPRTSA